MKKLLQAFRLLQMHQAKIEEPDECVSLQFEALRQPLFTLQHKYRISATFAADFWSTPERRQECELQAKTYLIETIFSDIRPLIERLRLDIISRNGKALATLQELERCLFEVGQE